MFGSLIRQLMHGDVTTVLIVSDPFLRLVELLEFLKNEAVVGEFVLSLTIYADSSNKSIIPRWLLPCTIDTKQSILINIDLEWHRLIRLQPLRPKIHMIERLEIDHQDVWVAR